MVESPHQRLVSDKSIRNRSIDGTQHRKADLTSLHTPPALFPDSIESTFKRARTTSPPTSIEEGSETEAEAILTSTSSSETLSELAFGNNSSPRTSPFPNHQNSTTSTQSHQQTPLRFSFGMNSSSSSSSKTAVDGLLTEKMLSITVPDGESHTQEEKANLHIVHPSGNRPDASQQTILIKGASDQALQADQSWYLVDRKWYRHWSTACSDSDNSKNVTGGLDVGPVETKTLLQTGQGDLLLLKLGLIEGVDFELLSSDAWRLLITWYGLQDPPIERKVIRMPSTDTLRIELYPPLILISTIGEVKTSLRTSLSVLATLSDLKEVFLAHLSSLQSINELDIRFWRLPLDQGGDEPAFSPLLEAAGVELISEDKDETTSLAELQVDQPIEKMAVEVRKNGSPWHYTSEGKVVPSVKGIFKQDGGDFLSRMQSGKRIADDEGASSSAGRVTRSQTAADRGSEKQRGLTGLYNLGNTCFMNSALQCMSNTKELKDYFVSGVYKAEVNTSNPLGLGGAMAKVFGELLSKLWSSGGGAWHPREFKTVLSRFSPQFIGYSQQDSQELLAFVLDGLHEDLNRIVKKPYIEAPDWQGGGTKEMVAFAHRQWEIYKLRNDSVIVDLFQGQYRSTLVCPDCAKVSIKFDPFMYLTLPIPNRKSYNRKIIYIPWSRDKTPIEVQMRYTGETSIQKLKKNLGEWFNANPSHMIACDVFSKTFYRIYGDFENATEIAPSDVTYIYELPTALHANAPITASGHYHRREHLADLEHHSKIKYDSSRNDEMILLPVFSTTSRQNSNYYNRNAGNSFGQPFFVAIPHDESHDEEAIRRAVMEKYLQYASHSALLKQFLDDSEEDASGSSPEDWDMLNDTPTSVVLPEHSGVETVTEIHDGGETVHIVPDLPQESHKMDSRKMAAKVNQKIDQKKRPSIHFVVHREDNSPLTLKSDGYEEYGEELHKRAARLASGYHETSNQMDTDHDDDLVHVEARISIKENSWPLVYTGGALVCVWPEKIKERVFGDDDDAWAGGSSRPCFVDPELEAERNAESGGKKAKATITIDDCLNEFTKEEQLGESDPWYCPQCKDFKQATKKFDLWKVPDILVVHFKRFSSGRVSRDKIDSFIDFPINGLDLTDRVEGAKAVAELHADEQDDEKLMKSIGSLGADDDAVESDAPLYDLYAVDNHYGGLGGGHYTAYAKNPEDDRWYYFDDSSVRYVGNTNEVKGQSAYLLFYRRRTTRPIGGKSREKVREKVKSVGEGEVEGTYQSSQGQVNYQGAVDRENNEDHPFDGQIERRDDQAKLAEGNYPLNGESGWNDDADNDMQVLPLYGDDETNGWDTIYNGRIGAHSRSSSASLAASLGDEQDADADSEFGLDNASISSINDDPLWPHSGNDSRNDRPIETTL